MADLTNITHPKFRCTIGACPAVYKSEDGKTFTIIGAIIGASQIGETKVGFSEEAVEISADLLLSSLGIADLIEAAEQALEIINETGALVTDDDEFAALRSVLTRIQGGDGNG